MKRTIKNGLFLVLASIGLSSCLKDAGYTDLINAVGDQPIASIFGAEGGATRVVSFQLAKTQTLTYAVNVSGSQATNKDVNITLGASQAVLDNFNTARRAAGLAVYEALPAAFYKFTAPTVIVKAGKRDANFTIEVTLPGNHNLQKNFLIPLAITDASGLKIASNTGFMNIDVKAANQWEGNWKVDGDFKHPTAPRLYSGTKKLSTIDATTSQSTLGDLGAGYPIEMKVLPNNTVEIIQGAGSTGFFANFETIYGRWIPASNRFEVQYQYGAPGAKRNITEVYTKQ